MEGDSRWAGLVSRLNGNFGNYRNVLTSKLVTGVIDEPIKELGEIHGSDSNFLRLQSAFRELEKENQILRERYIKWQVDQPNVHLIEDKERVINHLRDQILQLNGQISSLKGKETVSVNVQGNTSEYEIKIRTLNSRIQELESQNRTVRIDLEGQLRTKNNYIRELEERLGKLGESGVTASQSQGGLTPYGGTETSGADRLSSSVHSSQSGNDRSTSRYGATTTSTYQSGSGTGGQTTTTYTSSSSGISGSGVSGGSGISGSGNAQGTGSSTYQSSSYSSKSKESMKNSVASSLGESVKSFGFSKKRKSLFGDSPSNRTLMMSVNL